MFILAAVPVLFVELALAILAAFALLLLVVEIVQPDYTELQCFGLRTLSSVACSLLVLHFDQLVAELAEQVLIAAILALALIILVIVEQVLLVVEIVQLDCKGLQYFGLRTLSSAACRLLVRVLG